MWFRRWLPPFRRNLLSRRQDRSHNTEEQHLNFTRHVNLKSHPLRILTVHLREAYNTSWNSNFRLNIFFIKCTFNEAQARKSMCSLTFLLSISFVNDTYTSSISYYQHSMSRNSNQEWQQTETICVGFEVFTAVVMKSIIFWDTMPCIPLSFNRRFGGTYRLHLPPPACSLVCWTHFFHPEDGGDMFLRKVGWNSTDYMASYPRR
jgi:hypothetical protein